MKKIRVLQVNKLYAPETGGVEKVVQDISEGMKKYSDINNRVLVCMKQGKSIVEKYNGVKVFRAGSIGTYLSMPVSFDFFNYFKKLGGESDVIHFHMPFPLADVANALINYDGKVVIWWHSDIVRQKAIMPFYKPFMKKLLDRADCIIAATCGHINSSLYLPPYKDKCRIVPFGIDEEDFKTGESKEKILNNYDQRNKKVLFVGRLVYYKGISVLIDAFFKVKNAELFIVGEGSLEKELVDRVKTAGAENKIHFMGFLDDSKLKAALRDCDMFVLPSVANSEAFGLVQLEAMIYGKPVINTKLPTGVPYVSIDSETGFTVEPGNVEAMAAAVQRLVDNDELRKNMGESAYSRVKEEFDKKLMIERVYNIYCELAGK